MTPADPVRAPAPTPPLEDETYLRRLLDDLGNAEVQVHACYELRADGIRTDADYQRRCAVRDAEVERVVAYFREEIERAAALRERPAPAPQGGGEPIIDGLDEIAGGNWPIPLSQTNEDTGTLEEVARAFYRLTVTQRDAAWRECERLRAELALLRRAG